MMRTPGTELLGMQEIEDLGKKVPRWPNGGALDLQRDKEWGGGRPGGKPRSGVGPAPGPRRG